jgi:hypothetical protein
MWVVVLVLDRRATIIVSLALRRLILITLPSHLSS